MVPDFFTLAQAQAIDAQAERRIAHAEAHIASVPATLPRWLANHIKQRAYDDITAHREVSFAAAGVIDLLTGAISAEDYDKCPHEALWDALEPRWVDYSYAYRKASQVAA